MKVTTKKEAMRIARMIISSVGENPDTLTIDAEATQTSGSTTYRMPNSSMRVIDMETRIEVVYADGDSEMIWIEENAPKQPAVTTVVMGFHKKKAAIGSYEVDTVEEVKYESVVGLTFDSSLGGSSATLYGLEGEIGTFLIGKCTDCVEYIRVVD